MKLRSDRKARAKPKVGLARLRVWESRITSQQLNIIHDAALAAQIASSEHRHSTFVDRRLTVSSWPQIVRVGVSNAGKNADRGPLDEHTAARVSIELRAFHLPHSFTLDSELCKPQ